MDRTDYLNKCKEMNKAETNADKIRNMNDDELADYLGNIDEFRCAADDGNWKCETRKTCRDCIFDWLRQEATNGQN